MAGLTTEEINKGAFAIIALQWLADNQVTIVHGNGDEYWLRLFDGSITNETYKSADEAVQAGMNSIKLPLDN